MPLQHKKPNRALLRELNAVARKAKALEGVLGRANFLPDGFPDGELRFWIDELQALPRGTAEGCREPLRFAHERLSAVIRDHIDIDDDEADQIDGGDTDAPPSLARDEPIDQAITNLLGAVSVANSEYERQADESLEEEERDRPLHPDPHQAAELKTLGARAEELEAETETLRGDLSNPEYANETETTDQLKRQTQDAETTLAVTRHAAEQPTVRPNQMTRLSRALSAVAAAAAATWRTARLGLDLTEAGVRHFSNWGSEQVLLPFKHVRAFADEVEAKIKAFQQGVTRLPKFEVRPPFSVFREVDAPWCPELVMIPAGSFWMGSPETEEERSKDEGPQHEVVITRPFALGRYAVTFAEYDHYCDETGCNKPDDEKWGRGRRPVINVDHGDAEAYCAWLSEAAGAQFQLPTEAMWEYACRAGTTTPFSFGDTVTTDQVNYDGNHPYAGASKGTSREQTVPVGTLPANSWGLFEMHGNVWEWCADGPRDYQPIRARDPHGSIAPRAKRVVRGGSWVGFARLARAPFRFASVPGVRNGGLGFRCARVQDES